VHFWSSFIGCGEFEKFVWWKSSQFGMGKRLISRAEIIKETIMGLGWNVTFENRTGKDILISKNGEQNWYAKDLEGLFTLKPNDTTTKYTEIQSSGISPFQRSYLILLVQLSDQKHVRIELKGTNGDLDEGFKQIVDGDGFEVGMEGETNLINFTASKDKRVNLNLTFV
jgi:hypothetical protein